MATSPPRQSKCARPLPPSSPPRISSSSQCCRPRRITPTSRPLPAGGEMLWTPEDRAVWEAQNRALAENIVQAVQQDRGRRVLVAVQCQRLHRLMPLLHDRNELIEIVDYRKL